MVMRLGGFVAVTTQLPIAGDLLGRQDIARLEMRGQMYRSQTTLQRADRGGLRRKAFRRDPSFGKEPVQFLLAIDDFAAQRLRGRAQALANVGHQVYLPEGQLQFLRERKYMQRTGIAIELSRFRQTHASACAELLEIFR